MYIGGKYNVYLKKTDRARVQYKVYFKTKAVRVQYNMHYKTERVRLISMFTEMTCSLWLVYVTQR